MTKPCYRCDTCGDLYLDEDDAYDCCPHTVSVRWVCPICEGAYELQWEADGCCRDQDELPPLTASQLEAAGQQRLFP